ncbi:MAG: glycosyltransferase family 39 protein [bacterium]|nr:MAG: glycosyltransferase family 39 protein [bacterium]
MKIIKSIEQVNTRKFLIFISLMGLLILSTIAWFVYEGVPKGDAVTVFFQTKIFACGKLFAVLPEHSDFFHVAAIIRHQGKWFSMLPPGHSLVLVPFYLIKLSWLSGPFLGVLSLILIYLICRHYFGENTAKVAVILTLISPYFLLLQASFLPHSSGLFFALLFCYLFLKAVTNHSSLHFLFAGLVSGMLFLIRPYTSIAIIFPFIVYSLYLIIKQKIVLKNLALLLIGIAGFGMLTACYNKILTGNFFTFPYDLHRVSGYNQIGFGSNIGTNTFGIQGHTPIKAIINLGYNFFVTSMHLHGMPFLSLLPAAIFLLKGNKNRYDYLLCAVIFSLLLFHFFYWFHGVNSMGSRYYYETFFAMLILSARGIIFLSQKLAKKQNTRQANFSDLKYKYLSKIIMIILLFNLTIYLPRCFKFFRTSGWGETRKIYEWVKNIDSKTLIFIKPPELTDPLTKNINMFIYGSGFNFNDPWLEEQHLFVRWLGENKNQELKQFYRDRVPYLVTFEQSSKKYMIQPY